MRMKLIKAVAAVFILLFVLKSISDNAPLLSEDSVAGAYALENRQADATLQLNEDMTYEYKVTLKDGREYTSTGQWWLNININRSHGYINYHVVFSQIVYVNICGRKLKSKFEIGDEIESHMPVYRTWLKRGPVVVDFCVDDDGKMRRVK